MARLANQDADPISILIYGDSNTWGFNPESLLRPTEFPTFRFPYRERWCTLVQQSLGNQFVVYPEGLNARTTIHNDVSPPPCAGEYECNGRRTLLEIVHSHKPLDIVVLALSTNDFKTKFARSNIDIVDGIRVLVRDIQRSTEIGHVNKDNVLQPPKIIVVSNPIIKSNSISLSWGFPSNVEERSKDLIPLLKELCESMGIGFVDLASITTISAIDGVHVTLSDQPIIANAVVNEIRALVGDKVV
jgi:lysophospholipase L1-like esterase